MGGMRIIEAESDSLGAGRSVDYGDPFPLSIDTSNTICSMDIFRSLSLLGVLLPQALLHGPP